MEPNAYEMDEDGLDSVDEILTAQVELESPIIESDQRPSHDDWVRQAH